jgi:hypothetical protein
MVRLKFKKKYTYLHLVCQNKFFYFKEKVIKEKEVEYEIGRKHLAKMMGYDPNDDKFDQDDIDVNLTVLKSYFSSIVSNSIESHSIFTSIRFV